MNSHIIRHRWTMVGMAVVVACGASGCFSSRGVPANRLPPGFLAQPHSDRENINFIRLRQDPPKAYLLGPRDVLGVYVEGVLGTREQPMPVHFPEQGDMSPATGYPMPIRDDGTVALPLLPPLRISGLTVTQAEDLIREKYTTEFRILQPGRDRIIVTLMRKRTYQVLVVREDGSSIPQTGTVISTSGGLVKRGTAKAVELKAYENDVLHALSETGGLPGLDAKNEVKILRGAFADAERRDEILQELSGVPVEDAQALIASEVSEDQDVIRIPLRIGPNDAPVTLNEEDIILATGDIVFIETRDREVFYTGGLLVGKEQMLPRDYDLDVLGAIALGGGSVAGAAGGYGNPLGQSQGMTQGISTARGIIPPSECV
ncbi:MAG TPA: polysaccharide biosynthesis/export family protein, partial [Pirellulales bacterium]|nr:polysaccharide biosynthesis/export family protein [Pirellulales bacterium]